MSHSTLLLKIVSEIKLSLKLAIPLIISELIFGLSGFISTIMVAKLGREALAANALVWPIFITLILFFIGVLSAAGVLIAQSHGANNPQGVQTATKQGLILGIIFVIPMFVALWIAPKLLILTGQDPTIVKIATPYFHALIWGMLPLNLLIVMEHFLLGIAKTRLVLISSVLSVPLNIIFFYLFLFGKFGFPNVGLPGIGYGSALSNTITAIILGIYVHFSKHSKQYKIFSPHWHINKKFFWEIIRVGAPLGAMYCIEFAFLSAIAVMMGKLGADVLAAHQITFQCVSFAVTVIFALSQAVSIRVGHEVGHNIRGAIKLVAYVNMGLGLCWTLLLAAIYLFYPKHIIALDLDINTANFQQVIKYAINFLAIIALVQIFDCFRLVVSAALRGLKDTKFIMYGSIISFWVIAFPAAYLLGFTTHLAGIGIWLGDVVGVASATIILMLRFNYLIKHVDLQKMITK